MPAITDHNLIVEKCTELDALANKEKLSVHYLTASIHSYRLVVTSVLWNTLAENEKYCIVKYGNFFMKKEDAEAARDRAIGN